MHHYSCISFVVFSSHPVHSCRKFSELLVAHLREPTFENFLDLSIGHFFWRLFELKLFRLRHWHVVRACFRTVKYRSKRPPTLGRPFDYVLTRLLAARNSNIYIDALGTGILPSHCLDNEVPNNENGDDGNNGNNCVHATGIGICHREEGRELKECLQNEVQHCPATSKDEGNE